MNGLISFFYALPVGVRWILYIVGLVWAVEMFFLPFNINRLISRADKRNELLAKVLELTGKDKSIREDNEKILALLLGDFLEHNQKLKRAEKHVK